MLSITIKGTTCTLQEDFQTIHCTRVISNRICLVITKCGPTTIEFTTIVNRMVGLDDELFNTFDRIRRESIECEGLPQNS